MELYYQPHKSRKKEAEFVRALIKTFSIPTIITSYYSVPGNLKTSLDIHEHLNSLSAATPKGKKFPMLIAELSKLPPQIKVITNPKQISCDVVIVKGRVPYFIEFHENQHRTLSVNRSHRIYTMDEQPIIVPRYVQRFLRDIWRAKYLRPFNIVWVDWFEKNAVDNFDLFQTGFKEYSLPGRFNLANFKSVIEPPDQIG